MRYQSYERYCQSVSEARDLDALERTYAGPYYDTQTGTLRIPSYFFHPIKTLAANAEWRRRGLRYDGLRLEWFYSIAPDRARDQVDKARAVFNRVWGIGEEEGAPC